LHCQAIGCYFDMFLRRVYMCRGGRVEMDQRWGGAMLRQRLPLGWIMLAVLTGGAGLLYGQARPAAAPPDAEVLRLRKFSGVGRACLVKTPIYQTTVPRSATQEQDWHQVTVTYDTAPEWLDEVVFQYHVLSLHTVEGKRKFNLYRKAVRYIDIKKGRNHNSTVFLRPSTRERYGDVVAAAVEVMVGGKVVATEKAESMPMPDVWWKNPAVTESADLTVRDGYLLDRANSPFALINIDDYEVSR